MSVKILYLEIVIRDLRVLIRFATNNFFESWKGEQINEAFVKVVKLQIISAQRSLRRANS